MEKNLTIIFTDKMLALEKKKKNQTGPTQSGQKQVTGQCHVCVSVCVCTCVKQATQRQI